MIASIEQLIEVLRKPTGVTNRRRVGIGKNRHYEEQIATRTVYLCHGGGWAIDYQGGNVPESVVREAIDTGVLVDAFAGKFVGAVAGVGYELASHLMAIEHTEGRKA